MCIKKDIIECVVKVKTEKIKKHTKNIETNVIPPNGVSKICVL